MDKAGRIFSSIAIIFATLLVACLILSVASVIMLSGNEQNSALAAKRTEQRLDELFERMEQLENSMITSVPPNEEVPDQTDTELETGAIWNAFYLRETNGKIGIFNENGVLLQTVDILLDTLPANDQKQLADGIEVKSLQELMNLVQDYGG